MIVKMENRLRKRHPSDTDLERHYLGMMPEGPKLAALEGHLLVCGACVDRAEQTAGYVDAIRAASIKAGFDRR